MTNIVACSGEKKTADTVNLDNYTTLKHSVNAASSDVARPPVSL